MKPGITTIIVLFALLITGCKDDPDFHHDDRRSIHDQFTDEILQQAGTIREGRGVRNEVRIRITAGQVIGYIGPNPGVDIGMYDYEREYYFANPDMYGRDYRSAVCYTDYLP